jgi:RNA polymerase sigma-70 factor (ECF subfamily)
MNASDTEMDGTATPAPAPRFRQRAVTGLADDRDPRVQRAVQLAKQRDGDALRYIYIRYADSVFGYVRSIVRDEHEAEDITQQVFAKLMTVLPKYQQRDVPFSAWILRVARNMAFDHMRARRSIPCEEVRGVDTQFDQTAHDRSEALKAALELLPREQRDVLVLRHIVGLSPGEIALSLGKSEGSIHGLHHRGRRALKAALVDLECAPATSAALNR